MSMGLFAVVVETDDLLRTVAAAFVAGIGVTLSFSLGILGAARASELSRAGSRASAAAFGILALLGFLATGVGVAMGLALMLAE